MWNLLLICYLHRATKFYKVKKTVFVWVGFFCSFFVSLFFLFFFMYVCVCFYLLDDWDIKKEVAAPYFMHLL